MDKQLTYHPETVSHPGMMLDEKLEEAGMSAKEFAVRTNKPEKTINHVLKSKSMITPEMAVQFEKVLDIPAKLWLSYDRAYQEYKARLDYEEILESGIPWMREFPYREMASFGWVAATRKPKERVAELLHFFGIASPLSWKKYFLEKELKVAFRISLKSSNAPHAVSAWLRHGELQAREMISAPYDAKAFRQALDDVKVLIAENKAGFFNELQQICSQAGVKVIHSPKLPKAPINGATRWIGSNPVLQLSNRYKWHDTFWFNFFHEAGHILLHGKKNVFLEGVEYNGDDKKHEQEADEFASELLLPTEQERELFGHKEITDELLINLADRFQTHPGILVGRMHHVFGDHSEFNGLRELVYL
ncbi:MAG: ImmA/IrrE family metallo-endopeptidase [Balneolales bacterium]